MAWQRGQMILPLAVERVNKYFKINIFLKNISSGDIFGR
jgi:hypothetical protein